MGCIHQIMDRFRSLLARQPLRFNVSFLGHDYFPYVWRGSLEDNLMFVLFLHGTFVSLIFNTSPIIMWFLQHQYANEKVRLIQALLGHCNVLLVSLPINDLLLDIHVTSNQVCKILRFVISNNLVCWAWSKNYMTTMIKYIFFSQVVCLLEVDCNLSTNP